MRRKYILQIKDLKNSSEQKRGLTLGADVVIATPGRLIAHLSLGYVDLSRVSYFILDEADRMLRKHRSCKAIFIGELCKPGHGG